MLRRLILFALNRHVSRGRSFFSGGRSASHFEVKRRLLGGYEWRIFGRVTFNLVTLARGHAPTEYFAQLDAEAALAEMRKLRGF